MGTCYDGTLVMPRNYVAMNNEEMTYTEGGKVTTTNWYNAVGYQALYALGFGLCANGSYGAYFTTIAATTGIGAPLAVLTGLTSAYQIWYGAKCIDAASDAEILYYRYGKYRIVSTTVLEIPTGIKAERI